jgi:hypothetical protein
VVLEWTSKNNRFLQQAAAGIDGRADGRIEGRRWVKTPSKSFRGLVGVTLGSLSGGEAEPCISVTVQGNVMQCAIPGCRRRQ